MIKSAVFTLLFAFVSTSPVLAGEAEALARLNASLREGREASVSKNASGEVTEIRINAPKLTNEDLALFNDFPKLERLTISHAGYGDGKKTGVDFSGVAALADHPALSYFSAGGAVGKPYLDALAELRVPELYIQTTHTVDSDWAAIGTMKHLTYLGMRVRNDRMSELTDAVFEQLMPLENLERFFLSEMTFEGPPTAFLRFVTSRPKLKELTLRRTALSESVLAEIRKAKPELEIVMKE